MNPALNITITPPVTETKVTEVSPEIINVPMTRREALIVRTVLGQCVGDDSYGLFLRIIDVKGLEEPLVILNEDRIPGIEFAPSN